MLVLGQALSRELEVPFLPGCIRRLRDVQELKDVYGFEERTKLLAGLHAVDRDEVRGKKALLFDDLFRSGATIPVLPRR